MEVFVVCVTLVYALFVGTGLSVSFEGASLRGCLLVYMTLFCFILISFRWGICV